MAKKQKRKTGIVEQKDSQACPKCSGTGREEFNNGFLSRKCRECGGTGKVENKAETELELHKGI